MDPLLRLDGRKWEVDATTRSDSESAWLSLCGRRGATGWSDGAPCRGDERVPSFLFFGARATSSARVDESRVRHCIFMSALSSRDSRIGALCPHCMHASQFVVASAAATESLLCRGRTTIERTGHRRSVNAQASHCPIVPQKQRAKTAPAPSTLLPLSLRGRVSVVVTAFFLVVVGIETDPNNHDGGGGGGRGVPKEGHCRRSTYGVSVDCQVSMGVRTGAQPTINSSRAQYDRPVGDCGRRRRRATARPGVLGGDGILRTAERRSPRRPWRALPERPTPERHVYSNKSEAPRDNAISRAQPFEHNADNRVVGAWPAERQVSGRSAFRRPPPSLSSVAPPSPTASPAPPSPVALLARVWPTFETPACSAHNAIHPVEAARPCNQIQLYIGRCASRPSYMQSSPSSWEGMMFSSTERQ
uniref:Uncharacterized protein n=1 Tax=Plectus sambesii TaxID=2011161 RepID=A0A914VWX8_9BILA